jgi:hypothetical protein
MEPLAMQVACEARAMTIMDVLREADEGAILWGQAETLNITPRHLLRLSRSYLELGLDGLRDKRSGRKIPGRIAPLWVDLGCRLKTERYGKYSVKHFHEQLVGKHGVRLAYTTTKNILQSRGLATKEPGRGKYRRKRERRPMRGMMLHIDGSTHEWIAGQPHRDLIVVMDDADGRILYARSWPQEGTLSTTAALEHVLTRYGRFCDLYTDRGSHFCRTGAAGQGPDEVQNGHVSRALKMLGITHVRARSPQARGLSERAFRTIQGRLPKELRSCRTYGLSVTVAGDRGHVTTASDRLMPPSRILELPVTVPGPGFAVVDLRSHAASHESVREIAFVPGVVVKVGRDILHHHGGFEDIDLDDDLREFATRDMTPTSIFPCLSHAVRGAAGVCSVRRSGQAFDSVPGVQEPRASWATKLTRRNRT